MLRYEGYVQGHVYVQDDELVLVELSWPDGGVPDTNEVSFELKPAGARQLAQLLEEAALAIENKQDG